MRNALIVSVLIAGCAKKPAEQDIARPMDSPPSGDSAASQVVIAPDHAPADAQPTPPADCTGPLGDIKSDIHGAFQAANTFAPRKEAVAKWPAVAEACHNGVWYLEAALLFAAGEKELTAGNVKIASEEAALTLALQQPDDLDVLKRVALISMLGRKPPLPDDACKRAKAIAADDDRAAYVCARAAIASGDGKSAKSELAAIKTKSNFVDYELASAQAAKLNKDTKTMKARAKLATKLDHNRAGLHMIKEGDRKAIIELAKKLM